jgi:AcrR family transcriptional regulator
MNSPRRRADATENRGRIIAAAQALIMNADDLRLNEVAKRAGVGQGTLYRHFPTREDLLAEVYRHDIDELVAAAPALLAEHGSVEALTLWFRRVADYARVKRGVFTAVKVAVQQDLSSHSLGPIGDAVTMLLDAGKVDHTIRADVDARDVMLLIGFLSRLDHDDADERAHHVLDLIVDGLRSRG